MRRLTERAGRPRATALIAAAVALGWLWFGPPGGDAAAHAYQTEAWRAYGWGFWDNLWYAGRYSQVNYSLLYYPLASLVSAAVVIASSLALAAGMFSLVLNRQWPRIASAPSIAFACLAPLSVVAGTYPFMLGLAFALTALASAQGGRPWLAVGLAAITTLAHPLAFVFLLACLGGLAASRPRTLRSRAGVVFASGIAAIALGQFVLLRAFSADGTRYPFAPVALVAVAGFCAAGLALAWGVRDLAPLRAVFVAYAILAAAAFLVTSPIGGNVERLLLVMGAPLMLLPLAARKFRPRWATPVLLGAVVFWQAMPAVAGWRTASTARAQNERFWYPALGFLDERRNPAFRVEVVATADNWESFYLSRRGIPIARGWFRQDDWPENAALYRPLTSARYRSWLRRMGVRFVLRPNDPLDRTARAEAALLDSGRSGLKRVASVGAWEMYELPNATPIATPRRDIAVVAVRAQSLTLRAKRPGSYRLSVRYTPYWRVVRGAACVRPLSPWGTELVVDAPGIVRLNFGVRPSTLVATVLGERGGCPARSIVGLRGPR